MGMLFLITHVFVRDGGFHQFDSPVETAIMLMFWTFGLAGSGYSFNMSRVALLVDNGQATVHERWPFRTRTEKFDAGMIGMPAIEAGKDSEGDAYFRCIITTPSGKAVTVAEGNDREAVEAKREKLLAALA
jgi:hypothetical protein